MSHRSAQLHINLRALVQVVWLTPVSIHEPIGPIRPLVLIMKSRGLRNVVSLFWKCIMSARILIILFFAVTVIPSLQLCSWICNNSLTNALFVSSEPTSGAVDAV